MRYTEKRSTSFKNNPCHDSFICKACGKVVAPEGAGTKHRNHCPDCLSSLHVDDTPGDRAADCDGIMDPIGVWVRKNGEWAIIHRCTRCGQMSSNRLAADDNPIKLMSIALKPLASPPFPIEGLTRSLDVSPDKEGGRVMT
ncbi:RNHCP domain-containing protein [Anoxynatronum sibiricum]|uniref:RNHCP domain-containing protein n=1 Tax=Anoxynatronum sibiricum TaxID=210623 RepID=A0ABU9VW74_9CLOT